MPYVTEVEFEAAFHAILCMLQLFHVISSNHQTQLNVQLDSWEPLCSQEYFFNDGVEIVVLIIHEKEKRANDKNMD